MASLRMLVVSAMVIASPRHVASESSTGSRLQIRKLPEYQDLAPCPCDLWEGRCDQDCCCDQDCADYMMSNFTCVTFGGRLRNFPDQNCSSAQLEGAFQALRDEHIILCLSMTTTPYLGSFHKEVDILESHSVYDLLKSEVDKHTYTFDAAVSGVQPLLRQYKFGSKIRTVYNVKQGLRGYLHLPQTTFSGHCRQSPVTFLKDVTSICWSEFRTCAAAVNTRLDLNMFLRRNSSSGLNQDYIPGIKQNVTTSSLAPALIRYFLADNAHSFIKHRLGGLAMAGVRHHHRVQGEDRVHMDSSSLRMVYRHGVSEQAKGEIRIRYDASSQMCRNLVLEVEYHLFWNGPNILKIEVDVLLGNIMLRNNLAKGRIGVRQGFTAKFHHVAENEKEVEPPNINKSVSGHPGYHYGMPILSGSNVSGRVEVDKSSSQFRTWRPVPSGLCRDAGKGKIEFGHNSISGCLLRLTKQNFSDCDRLRAFISGIQEELINATVIGKGPLVNTSDLNDFVEILYADVERNETQKGMLHIPQCLVPSHLRIEITFSAATVLSEELIYRINGILVTRENENWTWSCRGRVPGECRPRVDFELRTSVLFGEIPLQWHLQNTSRFWVLQESVPCNGDICWKDILAPFTSWTTGIERSVLMQWMLLLAAISGVCLFLTRPYW